MQFLTQYLDISKKCAKMSRIANKYSYRKNAFLRNVQNIVSNFDALKTKPYV